MRNEVSAPRCHSFVIVCERTNIAVDWITESRPDFRMVLRESALGILTSSHKKL